MKKLLVLLLTVLMTLTLAACGGGEEASKDTIVIGGSGPITGDYKEYGLAVMHGAEVAVAEINALEGKEFFKLEFEDDQADPEIAVNAFNTLMDKKVQVSLLTTTSGACTAAAPLVQEAGLFGITPSGSEAAIPGIGANIFQMCFTDPNQGVASADYIKENFPNEVVGVIYQDSTAYSKGIYKTFDDEAKKIGLEIAGDAVATFGDSVLSYDDQVAAMKNAGCTVVFLPIYYTEAAGIISAAAKIDYKPVWFGVDGMDGILSGVENFDNALAEGVYLLTPFSADAEDAKTANFVKSYTEKYGQVPNQFGADSYDCVYAIYEAVKAKGLSANSSTEELTAGLIEWFTAESTSFNGVTGQNIKWLKSGEVTKAPMAVVIENGAYVLAK